MTLEKDLARFAAVVREYHRQDGDQENRIRAYRDACDTLQDEIGEARMRAAQEEYEEQRVARCEAREAHENDPQR